MVWDISHTHPLSHCLKEATAIGKKILNLYAKVTVFKQKPQQHCKDHLIIGWCLPTGLKQQNHET